MPSIAKIRFTNVVYENGGKRFNDDIFDFDGENGAIILENGGGKTVFVQTALQAVLPHYNTEERKIRETLSLESSPCHIGIEWITNEKPRRYVLTAVTLFIQNNRLESFKYVYEYGEGDKDSIVQIPFSLETNSNGSRPADKGEILEYYQSMQSKTMAARVFNTIKDYHEYIESNYKIIPSEWRSIGKINSDEGGVEGYFGECKNTLQLVNRLLIPVVEEALSEGGNKDFVDTFEKQREHFKQHKQLRERIKESQIISKKIDDYVNVFKDYHDKQDLFIRKKSYAKAVYEYLQEEKTKASDLISENKLEIERIEKSLKYCNQKKVSLEIAYSKASLEHSEKELEIITDNYMESHQNLEKKKALKTNLEISKLKSESKETEEKINICEHQIEKLEEELNLDVIRDEIEENKSKIKGYFVQQENRYQKEIDRIEIEKENTNEELNQAKNSFKESKNIYENLKIDLSKKEATVAANVKMLSQIRSNISGFNPNERAEMQQIRWSERISNIQHIVSDRAVALKEIKHKRLVEMQKKEENETQLNGLEKEEIQLKEKLVSYDYKEKNLLKRLKTVNESWYTYDSIYKRETSIVNYLENKIELLEKEKELNLKEERQASRYSDDYGELREFISEPMINSWIEKWKSKFAFIESGTEYFQRAAENIEDINSYNNGIWASAIVVKKEELFKLKELIESFSEELTYPIYLINQEEARDFILNNKYPDQFCFPRHWNENLDSEVFKVWKEQLNTQMENCKDKRKQKENEIQKYFEYLA